MKWISGGQTSVGADAKLLSSHAGDPRAATGDTTDTSHTRPTHPAGRQPVIESARRRPEDLPVGSDVTDPQPRTVTQRPVIHDDQLEGLVDSRGFPLPFGRRRSLLGHPVPAGELGVSSRSAYRPTGRTQTGFPCSARTSCDRGGCPLYSGDDGARPDRSRSLARAGRISAACPSTPPRRRIYAELCLTKHQPRVQTISPVRSFLRLTPLDGTGASLAVPLRTPR